MNQYIIRTQGAKTHLLSLGKGAKKVEPLGYIDYNFILKKGKLPVRRAIETPRGIAGYVETFYPSRASIRIHSQKREEIAYLEKSHRFRIDGVYISFHELSRDKTMAREEEKRGGEKKKKGIKEKLEKSGIIHSYILDDSEIEGEIHCFARENDISTLLFLNTEIKAGLEELLRFLPLAIARRVFEQDFIRRFMASNFKA